MTGRTWVFGDALNTDAMYPAHAMKLEIPEAARYVFHEIRPGWTDLVEPGDIVVAGRNFGVGSSRPVAALLLQLGVGALLAEEFNSLFFRNAINAGLPALTVPDVTGMFRDGDLAAIDPAVGVCRNETTGAVAHTAPLPPLIREILTSGGLLARLADQGYLPAHLAPALRSPAARAATGSGD
ncbi:3-isopropylmalate dehydratase [Nocardia sp. BMG111209]|uniref:LeuD/DmdB family oxidoreductase small subunit n=1 Tax=Nocardia sp. BMG111209 TaxID=1160137 RepID=UPI0018CA6A78|nr:3-isopropylmalate dehydratase [Nocardia sp. BMG111209]